MKRTIAILFLAAAQLALLASPTMPWLKNARGPSGAGAPSGPTYLINQNFETATTGYDNSETWTSDGTVDAANTTTPLVGAQSARLESNFASITSPDFTGQSNVWVYARLKGESNLHGAGFDVAILSILNSSDTILAALVCKTNTFADLYLQTDGSNTSASATDDDPAGSDWHVWLHFVSGGTCTLYMSTTGTRPSSDGSGTVFLTKTGASGTAVRIRVQNGNTAPIRVDRILVSASEIGDNP